MDKSWIQCDDKLSKEYTNGVNSFISIACDYLNDENKTHCPCTQCVNFYLHDLPTLKRNLWIHGFSKQYVTWTYHGENATSSSDEQNMVEDDAEDNNENVILAVNDAGGVHSKSNQDSVHREDENNSVPQKFTEILEEAKKELYPGCSKMSSLRFIVEFMHCKVLNGWSISSFDMALKLLRESLPEGHRIPENYRAAKRMLRELGLGYQIIHVCPNNCVLFRKQFKGCVRCPVCQAERYKFTGTKGKKIPEEKMHYFSITPRLQRLFMSRHTCDDMRWHKEKRVNIEGVLRHPADAEAWKHFDHQFPWFAEDPRNVRLGLATYGFNPYGDRNTKYSMWLVILVPYNMPSWRSMKQMFFIMALLIPGEKAPGAKIDVFLEPLIDELQELWKNREKTYDISKNKYFTIHAAVLWTNNDFPADGTISGWCTHGYKACPICNEDNSSFRIRN